jgi:hypothetical protein
MDTSDNVGFEPDFQAAWRNVWPRLQNDVDSLILFAFRVLVSYLDQHGFFRQPPSTIRDVKAADRRHPELMALVRRENERRLFPALVPPFAELVYARLDSNSLDQVAQLAFAIDEYFGRKLSRGIGKGKTSDLQKVTRAVNGANSVLLKQRADVKPIILVRLPERYWSKRKGVVPKSHHESQGTDTHFTYLLPTVTRLKRVQYSAVGGGPTQKLIVSLWPVEAPSIGSGAIKTGKAADGRASFYFRCWRDLPENQKERQTNFANLIADYIRNDAPDALDTVHIIAAPELTLAPQSHDSIVTAVETHRKSMCIVFPGSYHIEMKQGVINRAPIYVGGVLHQTDLTGDSEDPPTAAVKHRPFAFTHGAIDFREDIDGRESLTHLLDTSVGRIAVMICRDFIEDVLRTDVVSMCVDHLFILSMSPDSGRKFETAMESASNYRTGCFFVNAFTKNVDRRAAHRAPLVGKRVEWMSPDNAERYWAIVLEPE